MNNSRQPAGQPTGGQFAPHDRQDSDVTLGSGTVIRVSDVSLRLAYEVPQAELFAQARDREGFAEFEDEHAVAAAILLSERHPNVASFRHLALGGGVDQEALGRDIGAMWNDLYDATDKRLIGMLGTWALNRVNGTDNSPYGVLERERGPLADAFRDYAALDNFPLTAEVCFEWADALQRHGDGDTEIDKAVCTALRENKLDDDDIAAARTFALKLADFVQEQPIIHARRTA